MSLKDSVWSTRTIQGTISISEAHGIWETYKTSCMCSVRHMGSKHGTYEYRTRMERVTTSIRGTHKNNSARSIQGTRMKCVTINIRNTSNMNCTHSIDWLMLRLGIAVIGLPPRRT
jgi:hypothetical protein